ncbi:MAG: hypothetical protein NVS9B15_13860 [Acidobacteriaceae bacterium]
MVLRLIEPTSGSVTFGGKDVFSASKAELRALRREMQIVFQDPFASLNPRMRVRDIVTEPLDIHESVSAEQRRERARELMDAVGLNDSVLARYPHEFSGGQRQRIGIARALCLNPRFLVLDEPVSALDVSVGAQIVNLLRDLQRQRKLTYLFISHSMPIVRYLSDRIAVMKGGELVELGEAERITSSPQHEYTRKLVNATPELIA